MSVRPSNGRVVATFVILAGVVMAALGLAATPEGQRWIDETRRGTIVREAISYVAPAAGPETLSSTPLRTARAEEPIINDVLDVHLETLRRQNLPVSQQGVVVETLDGDKLVAYNADRAYNPASVVKLVTTLVALEQLPPNHRFTTTVTVTGLVVNGVVQGDLGIRSDGDPTFDASALTAVADALKSQGVKRVAGGLVVSGPFTYKTIDETPAAIQRAKTGFGNLGIKIDGPARPGEATGTELVSVKSRTLIEIVQLMNAHSINTIADNLGTAVGGPAAMRRHLVERLGLPAGGLVLTNGSGLDENRLSAADIVAVVRALVQVADGHGIPHDHLIPLSGVDNGTMRARLQEAGVRGSVIAKTGTQPNVDGGVATLAGIAYTRDRGPVVFAIMNSYGDVHNYRKWEDALLRDVLEACGGAEPLARVENSVPPRPLGHDVSQVGRATVTTVGDAAE